MSWRALAAELLGDPSLVDPAAAAPASDLPPPDAWVKELTPQILPTPGALTERLELLREGPCPEGLSDVRWFSALERAEAFVLKWGAAAYALGWTADDLFSIDLNAWMRLDHRGALFLQEDADVLGVTADELAVRKGRTVFRIKRGIAARRALP